MLQFPHLCCESSNTQRYYLTGTAGYALEMLHIITKLASPPADTQTPAIFGLRKPKEKQSGAVATGVGTSVTPSRSSPSGQQKPTFLEVPGTRSFHHSIVAPVLPILK